MSGTMSRRSFAVGTVATILGGAAVLSTPLGRLVAAQGADLASLGLPTLDLSVSNTGFEGMPESVEAGRYLVNLTAAADMEFGGNAAFAAPGPNSTVDDLLMIMGGGGTPEASPVAEASAAASPEAGGEEEMGAPPTFVYQAHFAGGAFAMGGQTGQAVVDLTPGDWILWGDNPESGQQPIVFTVTGEMPADLAEPAADINVTFIDFGIAVDGSLTVGDHLMRIENQGAQPHFLFLAKGPDAMTNDDVAALLDWEMQGMQGEPPVDWNPDTDLIPAASTSTQSIGTVMWAPVTLEAGTYLAACFFPTAGEGLPHAYHGMHTVFTVS
jgi:hypothetical protein